MNVHYCMGEIAGADFGIFSHKSCSCKPTTKEKTNKCCEDAVQLVKLETDQKNHIQSSFDFTYFDSPDFSVFPMELGAIYVSMRLQMDPRDNPPPNSDEPIYLKNNVFRI